jgi:organic radical activating enzyme
MDPINHNGKKIIKIENKIDGLFLTWIINNICTYHCSYCPEIVHGGKNHHYDWQHVKPFIDQCFQQYPYVHCSLSGGEPTVSPFFKNLVSEIYDRGGTVHVTTNLVRSWEYWQDIAAKCSSISVSYHSEFVVSKEDEDIFLDKLVKLSRESYVTLRVMMHPKHWDRCVNFYDRALRTSEPFTIEVVRILPDFGTGNNYFDATYTEEQLKFFSATPIIFGDPRIENFRRSKIESNIVYDDGNKEFFSLTIQSELEKNKANNFYGWTCDIGKESLFVHYDGGIQRANCEVGGVIGNIVTGFTWPTDSVICNKKLCHCAADVVITKEMTKNV